MKIKKLFALVLSAMSLMGVFAFSGFSGCRFEADMVEKNHLSTGISSITT